MLNILNVLLTGFSSPVSVACPSRVNVQQAHHHGSQIRGCVPYQAPVPYTGGRVKALFVGINYVGTSHQLKGCVNDVYTMLSTLQQITFPISECCILVDDPQFPNFSDYPTRENMIRYMGWLVAGARPGDVLFFHYSGHGAQTKAVNDSEEEYDQVLCPVDFNTAGTIMDDDLFLLLCHPLPAGVRLTCVFDCCHSASMLDLPFSFVTSHHLGDQRTGHTMKKVRQNNYTQADILLFSGCTDDGTSADAQGGPNGAGGAATQAFTWSLLHTAGLSYMEILLKTRNHLKSLKYKQVPQLTSSKPVDLSKVFSLFGSLELNQHQLQQHVPQQFHAQPSIPRFHISFPPPGAYPRPGGPYGGQYKFSGQGYMGRGPGPLPPGGRAPQSGTGLPVGSYPRSSGMVRGGGPTGPPGGSYLRAKERRINGGGGSPRERFYKPPLAPLRAIFDLNPFAGPPRQAPRPPGGPFRASDGPHHHRHNGSPRW